MSKGAAEAAFPKGVFWASAAITTRIIRNAIGINRLISLPNPTNRPLEQPPPAIPLLKPPGIPLSGYLKPLQDTILSFDLPLPPHKLVPLLLSNKLPLDRLINIVLSALLKLNITLSEVLVEGPPRQTLHTG